MDGMSQILLTFCKQLGIWKKIPEPEDERSETSEAGDMAPESFRYFEISAVVWTNPNPDKYIIFHFCVFFDEGRIEPEGSKIF